MPRILAIADEVDQRLHAEALRRLQPDVVLSCGDLPFEYLETLVTLAGVPLIYVPGNHDPDVSGAAEASTMWLPAPYPWPGAPTRAAGPQGCDSADGRVVRAAGLSIAGLGGSVRYKEGPNQYTQREMRWRALRLEGRLRLRRALGRGGLDIMLVHAPPLGVGDARDLPHHGFAAFHRLVTQLRPRLLVHGHIHPVQKRAVDHWLGPTLVVNAIPHRLLEV